MGTPSAKRVAAKLTSAPTRNSLNILGTSGQGAGNPVRSRVVASLMGSMNTGKMGNPQTATPKNNRKVQTTFGDKSAILQSETKKINGSMDKLPASRGGANMKGVD